MEYLVSQLTCMILIRLVILIAHLYSSGVWLGLNLRTDIKKTCLMNILDYILKICSPF